MYKDFYFSIAGLFTTENRQPDTVANKIKCTTTPVGFHGRIWHQSLMSRVSHAILSAGLLWSLLHAAEQNRRLHQCFFWEGTYWTWNCYCQKEEKIASSSSTAGGLFKSVPESMSSKRAKPASGFFSLEKKGENYVDFGVSIVSLHHTSEGSSDFYWAYGWHFDFDSALLTLMLTPAVFLQKRSRHIRAVCAICTVYLLR